MDQEKVARTNFSSDEIAALELYDRLVREGRGTLPKRPSFLELQLVARGLLQPGRIDIISGTFIRRYHITDKGKQVLRNSARGME